MVLLCIGPSTFEQTFYVHGGRNGRQGQKLTEQQRCGGRWLRSLHDRTTTQTGSKHQTRRAEDTQHCCASRSKHYVHECLPQLSTEVRAHRSGRHPSFRRPYLTVSMEPTVHDTAPKRLGAASITKIVALFSRRKSAMANLCIGKRLVSVGRISTPGVQDVVAVWPEPVGNNRSRRRRPSLCDVQFKPCDITKQRASRRSQPTTLKSHEATMITTSRTPTPA